MAQLIEFLESIRVVAVLRGEGGGLAFQQGSEDEEITGVLDGDGCNLVAGSGFHRDQPIQPEASQRLAHRRLAHAQLDRELASVN